MSDISSSPSSTISTTLTKPSKTTKMPLGKKSRKETILKYQRVVFQATCFLFAGALLFLSSFISQNQRTMARAVLSFNRRLRKMDDRAILKLNQNNKIGNKETASCTRRRVLSQRRSFQNGGSCWGSLAPENTWKGTAAKDYFHKIKPRQKKMKPPYGEAGERQVVTVQKAGDRYRELMGLRCCSLSHQAAPHLSPPPDQHHSSALHATHIHLLVDFFFFSRFHIFLCWCV